MKKIVTLLTLLTLTTTLLLGKTLATVNGHKITDSLLAQGYEQLNETQKANLIDQLIKEELIYANFLKSPIVKSSKFKQTFEQQKKIVEQQYGKTLNKEQLRSIKGSIALSLYQEQEFKKAKVSSNEMKKFYKKNPKLFKFPNSVEIANIIVPDKATASKILKTLKSANNLDKAFMEAAKAQRQNGYMGWFGRDSMPTNLFDAAYKQKKGTLLKKPMKTKHGYNVVYLLNKRAAGTLSYDESKARIEQILKQKKVMDKLRKKMEKLYSKADIIK